MPSNYNCFILTFTYFLKEKKIFSSLKGIFSHRDNNTIDTSVEYLFAIILPPPDFSLESLRKFNLFINIRFCFVSHTHTHWEIANVFPFFFSFILAVIMVFVKENLYINRCDLGRIKMKIF